MEQERETEQMIAYSPYNHDIRIRRRLERYVRSETKYNFNNLNANLTLLRLYQYTAAEWNYGFVVHILVKGLMAMPARDFYLYLCVIPETEQDLLRIKALIKLHGCLENARFDDFWVQFQTYDDNYGLTKQVPDFLEAIRKYALHVLSLTYQKVPMPVISTAMNLRGQELHEFLDIRLIESGWMIENNANGDEFIILPRSEFNDPELKDHLGGCI